MSYEVREALREQNLPLTEDNINKVNAQTTVDTSGGSTTYVRSLPSKKMSIDDPNLNSAWQVFKDIGKKALTKGGTKAVDFVKQHGAAIAGLTGLGGAAAIGLGAYGLYKGAKALFGKKVKPEDTTYPPPPTDEYIYKPQYPTAPPYRPEAYAPAYPYYPNQSAPTIPYPYPTTPNNPQAIRPSIK